MNAGAIALPPELLYCSAIRSTRRHRPRSWRFAIPCAIINAAQARTATEQQTAPDSGFSFAAVGDTRPMMYLPTNEGKPDLVKLFTEMFGLVMPEKIAEEVVKRDVKMSFDPVTKELVQIVMPFMTRTEVMTLKVEGEQNQASAIAASVQDVSVFSGPREFAAFLGLTPRQNSSGGKERLGL